ncbi:serpentine type 7TM GPCR chemoreceptor Srz [Aquimarina sp. MAR_2010_214]|uniref:hypothetical protein n=1 Tax=Aquimarina sp. MAR_2010_214 TaxID=1250026 RepID=UPI000C6FDBE3|nr:hypothetical protein [Aquimarina sp. MAR_2010_214]PKV51319.1 serpentine type 7TM GPCR chemoreceptor Srz [Aquimarina sp. MAR_2010_214]
MNSIQLAMMGPWQIILLIIIILLLFVFPFYLIFYKRNEKEHGIPIFAKIILIIPSLTWVGIITGLYILFRKKEFSEGKNYKFNKSTRYYGTFLLVLSIACTVFYLIMKEARV